MGHTKKNIKKTFYGKGGILLCLGQIENQPQSCTPF